MIDIDPDTGKPYAWGWYCQIDLIELEDNLTSRYGSGQPDVCPVHGDQECLAWESWDLPDDFPMEDEAAAVICLQVDLKKE